MKSTWKLTDQELAHIAFALRKVLENCPDHPTSILGQKAMADQEILSLVHRFEKALYEE